MNNKTFLITQEVPRVLGALCQQPKVPDKGFITPGPQPTQGNPRVSQPGLWPSRNRGITRQGLGQRRTGNSTSLPSCTCCPIGDPNRRLLPREGRPFILADWGVRCHRGPALLEFQGHARRDEAGTSVVSLARCPRPLSPLALTLGLLSSFCAVTPTPTAPPRGTPLSPWIFGL